MAALLGGEIDFPDADDINDKYCKIYFAHNSLDILPFYPSLTAGRARMGIKAARHGTVLPEINAL